MSVLNNFPFSSGFFFVVFLLSGSLANSNLQLSPRTDSESSEDIEDLLRQVQLLFDMKMASKDVGLKRALTGEEEDGEHDFNLDPKPCNCSGVECFCCQPLSLPKFQKNGCIKMTYEPDKKAMLIALTLGKSSLPSKEVSVSETQPSPICGKVPKIKKLDSICIEFAEYKLEENTVNGCVKLKAEVRKKPPLTFDLGCFQLALTSTNNQHAGEAESLYFEEGKDSMQGPEPINSW